MKRVLENKKYFIIISLFVLAFLLLPNLVFAKTENMVEQFGLFALGSVGSAVAFILGLIAYIFTAVAGLFITLVVTVLVQVAGYSGIIYVDIVEKGWVIVRDLCNMFFILILLMIAFGTMLRQESYAAKKLLPKVLIMAILINFSKMFFGLIIDFAQVIMMTFVVSFRDGGGWFIKMFRVDSFLKLKAEGSGGDFVVSTWSTVIAIIMGCLAAIIALIVLVVMLAVLVIRIVMLWIYAILSPFVFLGWAFPPLQKYTNKIWEDFIKQVTIGPILAFFIWLALTSANKSTEIMSESAGGGMKAEGYEDFCVGVGAFFCGDELQKFIIVIGFLMGGLMVAQAAGGAAGSIAGKGMGAVKAMQGAAVGRVKDWTGVSAAQKYMAMRKTARDEKVRVQAEKLAGGVAKAKETLIAKPAKFLEKGNPLSRHGRKAEKLEKEAEDTKTEMEATLGDARKNIENGSNFKVGDAEFRKDKGGKWNSYIGGTVVNSGMKDDDILADIEGSFKDEIKEKKDGATEARNKQKKLDRRMKIGLGIGGAVIGGLSGVGLLGTAGVLGGLAGAAAGGVGGYFGAPAGAKKASDRVYNAGKTDLNLASNYRGKEVNDAKEKMKLDSDTEVLATLNDASINSFTRVAAAMEAMSRKLLSTNEVKQWRVYAQEKMGGGDKEWKDKRIGSMFEAVVEKNYRGATKDFQDLSSSTKKTKDSASERVTKGYEVGKYKLEDLDIDALEASISQLASSMKIVDFVSQFKALKDQGKKSAITRALKGEGSYEAKSKLAEVENIEVAFGAGKAISGSEKQKYTKSLTPKKILEIIREGKDENVKALQRAINAQKDNVSDSVVSFMDNGSQDAQIIKKTLGIP